LISGVTRRGRARLRPSRGVRRRGRARLRPSRGTSTPQCPLITSRPAARAEPRPTAPIATNMLVLINYPLVAQNPKDL
jgi:hypothetical protein